MDANELNELAKSEKLNIEQHGYCESLQIIDNEMRNNADKRDKDFYLTKEDEISEILGELLFAYGKLKSELEKYIVWRKTQLYVESETNKKGKDSFVTVNGKEIKFSRLAGLADDLAKSEVCDLYGICVFLHYIIKRAENAVITSRNHTYPLDKVFSNKAE